MPRIAVGGFQHETNTFAPLPADWPEFEAARSWPGYTEGDAIFPTFAGLNLGISGFIEAAKEWDLVPLLWCEAAPSGTVRQSAFDRITGRLCEMLSETDGLDGVYLDLHGAMVTDDFPDGEAEILARVRAIVGPDMPVVCSLDLHGNLSRAFFDRASAVSVYRTYPHVDFANTGARAAGLMAKLIERGAPFAKAWRQLDYIIPITQQSTMREPGRQLYAMLPGLEQDGVTSVDLAMGFPPADVPDNGATVYAYGSDQNAVDDAADKILAALEAAEDAFHNPLIPANQAVAQAMTLAETATKPVVIADPQDNPGAGGPGDSTGVLQALLDNGAQGAALSMLWDPETAAQAHSAGEGSEIEAELGGQFEEFGGPPIKIRAVVERISDGAVHYTGPMFGGGVGQMGKMACLRLIHDTADVRVVVASNRAQNADLACFSAIGIDPLAQRILCIKSAVHFLAAYEPIAETVLFAEAPGANPCQMDKLAFTRLRAGVRLGPKGPVFAGP